MTGVFDSGVGGLLAFGILRSLLPAENLVFLRDRKNCPYGSKTRAEIIEIAERNISLLSEMGCSRVLIACCTASTVYDHLGDKAREIAIPIVDKVAEVARGITENGRIGVIATDATVRSHAFENLLPGNTVYEHTAQPLVDLVEGGERDGSLSDTTAKYLSELLSPIIDEGIDTLILGCTHFHALCGEIERILAETTDRKIKTVSSAEVGARFTADIIRDSKECGRTVYI